MFEQLDQEKTPRVSVAMTLGILAAYLVGAFGGLCLFIALGDRPFGIQVASVTVYTYFAFWYVFFPTRGLLEKYSLRNKLVQRQLPRLLAIHCAFLILLVLGQTVWLGMKSRLPSYWTEEHGKNGDSLYLGVWIISPVAVFFTQVLISRRILKRSLQQGLNRPEDLKKWYLSRG